MSTLDTTFIIITAVCISLFFLILSIAAFSIWRVGHRLLKKAELAISGASAAGQLVKEIGGKSSYLAVYKLIKKLANNKK